MDGWMDGWMTPFHWSGRVRAAVDGNEANICLHWKQGGDPTGGYSRPHVPVRRPSEGGGFPETNTIAQLGSSLREIRDTWGTQRQPMAEIVSESWLEWGLGGEGNRAPRPPEANMLATHDAVTTNSGKAQQTLGKLVNQGRHAAHTASLDQLPDTARPPGPGDPLRGCETKAFAKARYRSLQGTVCLRARPTDSFRVIPAAEFVGMGRRFLGIEEHVAARCPCCDAVDVDTRHARICPRSGAQVNQHQSLLHAISRTLKRLGISHQVESG